MLQFTNLTPIKSKTHKGKYLAAGFGSIQNVRHSQRKLSNDLSVDIAQFKSFKQDFGATTLRDSLEANSQMTLSYQIKNSLHIQTHLGFTYSKQDIATISSLEQNDTRHEKMFYGSMGLDKYFLRDSKLSMNVGLARAKNYSSGQASLYPTASLTFSQMIKTAQVSLSLASEAMGGGSFTGMYGNQMLHHGKIAFNVPLSEAFQMQGDVGYGQTRDAFVGSQKANIVSTSVKANYKVSQYVQLGMGIYNRHLTNAQDFQNPVKEGMMYMASMKVSYF